MDDSDIVALPTPELLNSIVADRISVREAFGEVIDNSIDANARRVVIEFGESRSGKPQHIRIEDDGDGCVNLVDMVQLGKHTGHKTTLLGRFGIGLKYGALWLGGADSTITVTSTCNGITRGLRLNWREYAKNWSIRRDWMTESIAEPGARGTVVLIRPCIRRMPEGKAFTELVNDLGYTYSPAIKRGAQIIFRPKRRGAEPTVLERFELPAMSVIVDTRIMIDGRGARVYVGMVAEGAANPRPGITYFHGFRVILRNCGLGCGGQDYSNITGVVELDDSWVLTKNKDDISQHKEELSSAVFEVIRGLLEKAAARGQELEFAALNSDVEKTLNEMLGRPDRKGVRRPGDETGSKPPKNTGRRHKRADEEQPGETFGGRVGRLRVAYQNLGNDAALGTADASSGSVILNTAHKWIASARASGNAQTLAMSALLVFVDVLKNFERNGQAKIRYQASGDVVKDVGSVLSKFGALDGRDLLSVVQPAAE